MQRSILLIGAGKSATSCLHYLAKQALTEDFEFSVADSDIEVLKQKTIDFPHVHISALNVQDEDSRSQLISGKTIVISLLPAHLHYLVAKSCIDMGAHLLNASYVEENIRELEAEIISKGLLFVSELGLDPGIDHMSAMKLIHEIQGKGGEITSFKSHCGGLISPASDNNPWHYKISWNPRNIVLAGKQGALFKEDGQEVSQDYVQLFKNKEKVSVFHADVYYEYGFYPNRNSLSYIDTYKLPKASTFVRTTLRHPDFLKGWDKIIALKLTDDTEFYNSKDLSIKEIFKAHLAFHQLDDLFADYLNDYLFKEQFDWLDISNNHLFLNKEQVSMFDILQHCLELSLQLDPGDKDLVVMQHEIGYILENTKNAVTSTLYLEGEDQINTAMAKTVGLPLAITAMLILKDQIKLKGLYIPTCPEIYIPVLKELSKNGISFQDNLVECS